MKIIFSPSKEMRNINFFKNLEYTNEPIFNSAMLQILNRLRTFSKEEISSIMKVKNTILDDTLKNINNFEKNEKSPALFLYNGVAFKELELSKYNNKDFEFIKDKLFILSAFYGLSKPFTMIKKYRLDMTMKIFDISFYEFWKKDINDFIEKELNNDKDGILLNLASGEFSKIMDKKRIKTIINIDFKEYRDNKYISVSSYSKQARGAFLNIIIKNKIEDVKSLKNISFNNYKLNLELSDDFNFIFTR